MSRFCFLKIILLSFFLFPLTSCNSKNPTTSAISTDSSIIDETINQGPDTPRITEKDISVIKESLNKDSNYILLKEDQSFLALEGLTDSEDQLNTWVQ